jgi:hypothetical protein
MHQVVEIGLWIIVALMLVAVLMNPDGFVRALTVTFSGAQGFAQTLSGSGYVKAK